MRRYFSRYSPAQWGAAAKLLLIAGMAVYFGLLPGISVVSDLTDPALAGPGIPRRARGLHRDLTPRVESWAHDRIASKQAAQAPLHDVPTTEWPMFTAVFYLLATRELEADWQRTREGDRPLSYARGAVSAAKDLILDPSHHTWVKTHWGDDYMHNQNVFFRALIISGLTSYQAITKDGTQLNLLRDQVESLSAELDGSPRGVLDDYPGECYPIDVVVAVGFIRQTDAVLGTDHSKFVARALRGFTGAMADQHGLVPFRTDLASGEQLQPARGIGNSWVSTFAPDLWPSEAKRWYASYEQHFWQRRLWAEGFREFAAGTPHSDFLFEIDAGLVLDGFGTAANAFGVGAARRNGRFDHSFTLSTQMVAASWPLPGGTLLAPRLMSHATDAPYLGESGILYFLTVQPAPGVTVVRGGHWSGLVYITLLLYFGVGLGGLAYALTRGHALIRSMSEATRESGLLTPGTRENFETV